MNFLSCTHFTSGPSGQEEIHLVYERGIWRTILGRPHKREVFMRKKGDAKWYDERYLLPASDRMQVVLCDIACRNGW